MIEKKTVVNQIEVTENGHIQIRFAVQLVEDGRVLDSKWHRTTVEPGGDVDAQIAAVNLHLLAMGKAPVEDSAGVKRIKDIATVAHTPKIVADFKANARKG